MVLQMPYPIYIGLGFLAGATIATLGQHLLRKKRNASAPHRLQAAPARAPRELLPQRLKLFETIAANAAESIIVVDANEKIAYVNPAFLQLHGYTQEDILGKTPAILQGGQQSPEIHAEIKACLERNEAWSGILINRTKNEKCVSLETVISPVQDDAGKRIGCIAVGRDLTHQNLLETQLRHAQKMEAIGTLAGGIAHDFNNILSAIIGYTELAILDDQDQMPVRNSLDQILKAAKRAADLITQILTFSRRNTQTRQALYLKPILSEALKLLRGTLPSSIEIVSQFEEDAPPILADATQLHQIIMNLCTNAAHAMQPHGGTLTVTLHNCELAPDRPTWQSELPDGMRCVELTVADTGHGMPPEVRSRIFEPYFTTKRGGDGTGLGLATVHGIVKSHAGIIHVDSKVGQGTSFIILLPACAVGQIFPGTESVEPALPRGNKEKILVVDDEESLTMMISTALTYLGYEVDAYASSIKALCAFEAAPQSYDCIISDQTMPTLCGADLARRIFAIRPNIPFILCSGYSETINAETAHEIGIAEFVLKPATGRTLATIVHKLLHA